MKESLCEVLQIVVKLETQTMGSAIWWTTKGDTLQYREIQLPSSKPT